MTLNSIYFFPFMLLVISGMVVLQCMNRLGFAQSASLQKLLLLVSSYFFMGLSNYKYCIIAFVTSIFVYCIGLNLENKRWLLIVGITCLVAELGYFKYTNFLMETFAECFHKDYVVQNIILPLGISFYIFTAIGYLIDIYKNKYSPEKNFINLALMISIFTKVISGPIVRGKDFLPQLKKYKGISLDDVLDGLQIFVLGLFKKMVLADNLGVFVNDVFASPSAFNTISMWLAIVSYSLQIYFDFSGYSDMAIGASRMLGITINSNFNLPYIAKSPSEFWERWHISLSSWMREYLYFPLGGNKKGKRRTYMNLLLVMVISGLWHGAGWTFIVWGLLHGIYSCAYKCIDTVSGRKISTATNTLLNACLVIMNFAVVTVFWVFFRADTLENALNIFAGCFRVHTGINQMYSWSFFAIAALSIATLGAFVESKKKLKVRANSVYPCLDLGKIHNQIIFFLFVGITVLFGYFGDTAFIYGAF